MKKKLLVTLSVILILGMAAMGIVAYLTDQTDSAKNVMTMGNVDITQTETDGEGNDFVQDQPLYPNTSIDKVVTVTNTGKSDAYVRTWFAFEAPLDKDVIRIDGVKLTNPVCTDVMIDGTTYNIYVVEYGKMAHGDSKTSLTSISMLPEATNDDVAKYGEKYEVLVLSQAVQVKSFEDNEAEAWKATFGAPTEANVPWNITKAVKTGAELKDVLENATPGEPINIYYDGDATTTSTVGTGDGNRKTLHLNSGVAIENLTLTFDGNNHAIMSNGLTDKEGTIVFENCTFIANDNVPVYLQSGPEASKTKVIFNNCKFEGFVYFADNTGGGVILNNCEFNLNKDGYGIVKCMGGNHKFIECKFKISESNKSPYDLANNRLGKLNLYSESYNTTVTLENCDNVGTPNIYNAGSGVGKVL